MIETQNLRDAEEKLEKLCYENGVAYDATLNIYPPRMILRPDSMKRYQTCLFADEGGDVDSSENSFAVMVVDPATGKVRTMFNGRFVLSEEFQRKATKLFTDMRTAYIEADFHNRMIVENRLWSIDELFGEMPAEEVEEEPEPEPEPEEAPEAEAEPVKAEVAEEDAMAVIGMAKAQDGVVTTLQVRRNLGVGYSKCFTILEALVSQGVMEMVENGKYRLIAS